MKQIDKETFNTKKTKNKTYNFISISVSDVPIEKKSYDTE